LVEDWVVEVRVEAHFSQADGSAVGFGPTASCRLGKRERRTTCQSRSVQLTLR